jgi:hypothetical protein
MSNVRSSDRNGSCGGHDDRDIVLDAGHSPQPSSNGHYQCLADSPACREAQRLVRVPDWCCLDDGPYQILSSSNSRIVKPAVSLARAEAYLRDLGMREFDVQLSLYRSELWARRRGSVAPLYPVREGDRVEMFDVLTSAEVGGQPTPRTPSYPQGVTAV